MEFIELFWQLVGVTADCTGAKGWSGTQKDFTFSPSRPWTQLCTGSFYCGNIGKSSCPQLHGCFRPSLSPRPSQDLCPQNSPTALASSRPQFRPVLPTYPLPCPLFSYFEDSFNSCLPGHGTNMPFGCPYPVHAAPSLPCGTEADLSSLQPDLLCAQHNGALFWGGP